MIHKVLIWLSFLLLIAFIGSCSVGIYIKDEALQNMGAFLFGAFILVCCVFGDQKKA